MRRLIIDRFEGKYAICEDEERKTFAIEIAELPENTKVGSLLEINDDGEITVNEAEADKIREIILSKQRKLFHK